ncbi:helix-turn-helix domain-containing protein [Heliobacterium mobile]|uniref:helix-turn-helix domain-containing protein n=1 Tax=Heliobacterium mobile TaxID=28064 RepID=UPI001F2A2B76|nr:helix-turn-helix domain-containing protein [Heliobacterium mobile]
MTNYREILRLNSQGISQRSISVSCECSRNTVSKVLKRAQEVDVTAVNTRNDKWRVTQNL